MQQVYQQFTSVPKPIVKWAGGKRQMISVLDSNLPTEFARYHEPFLGGAALSFHILSKHADQRCVLSDLNSDLISTYVAIRDNIDELIPLLKDHQNRYTKNSKEYYYMIRSSKPRSTVTRAARLLFLNRTCFNGLYRVNSKGQFNVPLGSYSHPNIVNEENLRTVSDVLQSPNIAIECRDFESVMCTAKSGDLVYFDPPYHPVSDTASFTEYTNKDFGYDDLCRLAKLCNQLDRKGCLVMLSNSYSKTVRDLFDSKPWNIQRVAANRVINSNGNKRGGHYELLIKNY